MRWREHFKNLSFELGQLVAGPACQARPGHTGSCHPAGAAVALGSPPQSYLGRAASPHLMAENGLAHCVC